MADESLRELLARVHERLRSSSTVDPESREMLAALMRDIDSAAARDPASAVAPAGVVPPGSRSPMPPAHRLEAAAVRFESDHPAIAQTLRQIGALLGQAGI